MLPASLRAFFAHDQPKDRTREMRTEDKTPPTAMSAEAPDFSVIITTFNRPAKLPRALQALSIQSMPPDRFEVVVVDDGSTVPVEPITRQFADRLQIRCVRQPNGGPASGRNLGLAVARGRFIAFTDDDCEPAPSWLSTLAVAVARYPDCLIGGRTRNGASALICSEAAHMIVESVYRFYNRDSENARFFVSNNMAAPADLLRKLGGFDPSFRIASEDRNLCERWRFAGYRLVFVGDAVVVHFHHLSLGSFWRMHFRYGRGAARFHRLRASMHSSRFAEHCAFHRHWRAWLLRPFREAPPVRALRLVALLVVWQIANAAGAVYELCRRR
jgi:GT2 family glycosyltransferase